MINTLLYRITTPHLRRLSHSFSYWPRKYDINIALDKCTGTPKGHFSISQNSNTQSDMWGVVNQMKLMAESERIKRHKGQNTISKNRTSKPIEHKPNDEHVLHMFLEMEGFEYEDVMTGMEFLCDHFSIQELRWSVLCMQVDRKQMTMANLIGSFNEGKEHEIKYPSPPIGRQSEPAPLYRILASYGADEKQLSQIKYITAPMLHVSSYIEGDVARLMLHYLGTKPQSIIDEYKCVKFINIDDLIDSIADIKRLGYKTPHEVMVYLYMVYLPPHRRGARILTKSRILSIAGITRKVAQEGGLDKFRLNYLAYTAKGHELEETINYLKCELGFTAEDIAQAPVVIGLRKSALEALMQNPPERFALRYNSATNNIVKLNLMIVQLDQAENFILTALSISANPLHYDNDLFRLTKDVLPRKNFALMY